jgi:hypothetical protein
MTLEKLTTLFVASFLLLCSNKVLCQYAALSENGELVVIPKYSSSELVLIQTRSPNSKKSIALPEKLETPAEKSVGNYRLELDAKGQWIYWLNHQKIWRLALDKTKKTEWTLLYEHPKVRGYIVGFQLSTSGHFMLIHVDIPRSFSTDAPENQHWACRTVIPVDISNSGAYPASTLLFSDSSQLDQAWIVDESHVLAHYRNEWNSHRELKLYERKGMDQWSESHSNIFPDYYPADEVADQTGNPQILLYQWSNTEGLAFAQLRKAFKTRSASSTSSNSWLFSKFDDNVIAQFPKVPKGADRFMIRLSPNKLFVAGSSSITNNEDQSRSSELYIPRYQQTSRGMIISSDDHDTIELNGFAYFFDVSDRYGLVFVPEQSSTKVDIHLCDFQKKKVHFLYRTEE